MYYNDDQTTLDTKWVDTEALAVAKKLVTKDFNGKPDRNSIKSSQLRKFYADVKSLERSWEYQGCSDAAFCGILPQVKILKAKAAYAQGRGVVPSAFTQWVSKHVDAVSKPSDFKAFLLHFEAVVGFCYGEGLKD
ncbi:MAG: type III-A CRISPR-associated protein Csm2 [Desulfovibrio sp.]|nr:type III-A CRISPR-associated protein Csm2 [Desulfovibrio sp.]